MHEQNVSSLVVEIEAELKPVVPGYLDLRRHDVALLRQLLEVGNYAELRIMGHRMKGTGGSYGFDSISDIGEQLENAALAEDRPAINRAGDELDAYLNRVTVIYI